MSTPSLGLIYGTDEIANQNLRRLDRAIQALGAGGGGGGGSTRYAVRVVTADTLLTDTDEALVVDATNAASDLTLTLPLAAQNVGRQYLVYRIDDNSPVTVNIVPSGADVYTGYPLPANSAGVRPFACAPGVWKV
jgi:hypothetical protein